MNPYQNVLSILEDNAHLISMVPVDGILRFGREIGLQKESRVLDLCCGYGTMLKVWAQAFGVCGVGVDRCEEFLSVGKDRLRQEEVENITLVYGDVTVYEDTEKYDVVVCSETIENIPFTLALGERFLAPGGTLAYQRLYAKVPHPPQELLDFDGEVPSLAELNHLFHTLGFRMTSMASDTDAMWEQYVIHWSGNRDWERLRQNPDDIKLRQWIEKWYHIYFHSRRSYEGHALFGLKRMEI